MLLLAMGVVFELPVFILALVRLGVLSSAKLRRNRRIGYVAMIVLAVALPSVDPVTPAFEPVPLGRTLRGLHLALRRLRTALATRGAAGSGRFPWLAARS